MTDLTDLAAALREHAAAVRDLADAIRARPDLTADGVMPAGKLAARLATGYGLTLGGIPGGNVRVCAACSRECRRGPLGYADHAPGCLEAAAHLPHTKDHKCAAGCESVGTTGATIRHDQAVHGALGCIWDGCPCTAPYGRILPTDQPAPGPVPDGMPPL